MYFAPTSEFEISKIINQLPNKKSHGYDKISNYLLRVASGNNQAPKYCIQ